MSSSLVRTTLNAPVGMNDTSINVVSATGALDGNYINIDSEWFIQRGDASGLFLNVVGGQEGSARVSHNAGTPVIMGLAQDFQNYAPGEDIALPYSPPLHRVTYGAAGAITIPTDTVVLHANLLTGTAGAFTLALPTLQQEGVEIVFLAVDAEAYTVTTPSNGYNGADHIATFNGVAGSSFKVRAVNLQWDATILTGVSLS